MIGGWFGRPVRCSTGPGSPTPVPARSSTVRPARRRSNARPCAATAPRTISRSFGDVQRHRGPVEDVAGQVGEGDGQVGRADVRGQDQSRGRVEPEPRRRPSAGRRRFARRYDETGRDQRLDPAGDRGPGQAAEVDEFGAGPRLPVEEQAQYGPRGAAVLRSSCARDFRRWGAGLLLDRVQKCHIASSSVSTRARKLRVGIVGGGFMGRVHGRSALVAGAQVVGAVGSSPERAEGRRGGDRRRARLRDARRTACRRHRCGPRLYAEQHAPAGDAAGAGGGQARHL